MATTTPPTGTTAAQKSARALLDGTLAQYGLRSLGATVWNWYLQGRPIEQIMLDIRGTSEYKTRFPAMEALAKQGRAMNESEYISYERGAVALMRRYGVPAGMFDQPQDFTKLLTGQVALTELQDRLESAQVAMVQAPANTRSELVRLFGPQFAQRALMATFLDPNRALPILQRDLAAASVAGAAVDANYTRLGAGQAEHLAALGVTADRAREGFGRLGQMGEVFQGLPGERQAQIGVGDQLAAEFDGSATAQAKIANRQARRKAQFQGAGTYAAGQGGVSGLGSAAL